VTRAQIVGPKAGKRLRNDGALSVLVALGAILLYIAVRFDFRFAPGAILALLHDITITLGVFSIFSTWLEFSLSTIAALLTIVGYSLNDTIVVFDRIRENFDYSREKDLTKLVNQSVNETLSRTILTSLTTLFVVAALFIWGGGLIRNFAAALLIGVVVGTYSSIAIASPTVLKMNEMLPKLQEWFLPEGGAGGSGGVSKGGKKGPAARSGA
jgi:preprotein translocase subunit SecF